MTEQMTGGEALVAALKAQDVDTVFGLPGVQTYPIFDALHRASNEIRVVSARHEQTCAYMAMGYAKATGRPGVCSVVPGPGVLNASAALCTAAATCAPVFVLTGETPSAFIGQKRGHLHELPDQRGTLRSFIKWAERASTPAAAGEVVADGFRAMQSGRVGPVAVEMAWDVMAKSGPVEPAQARPVPKPPLSSEEIERAADLIRQANRPMITLGSGALRAGGEIIALAELLGATITSHRGGRGIVAADHPLYAGSAAAWGLWEETDLLIGIGTRCEMQAMRWRGMVDASNRIESGKKLVRIDVDAEEMQRLKPDAGILADAAEATAALVAALSGNEAPADAAARVASANALARSKFENVQPHVGYLDVMREVSPRDTVLVKDVCQAGFASWFAWDVYEPGTYITSGYQGNLGYAYPTALGAKVGRPDSPVICIAGDGGFLYSATELSTAAQHGIGVIVIVFNNSSYGNVRRDQQRAFDGREIASTLPPIDYVEMAKSMGVAGWKVDSPEELKPVLTEAIAANAPALIEVDVTLEDEVPPWPHIMRGGRPADNM